MKALKLVLAALTAAAFLSLAAGVASASRNLNFSERVITLLDPALTFDIDGTRIICEVGLTLNLTNNNVPKRAGVIGRGEGTVLGQETGERCSPERSRVRWLPFQFEIVYLSFNGTLPVIRGVNIQLRNIRILTVIRLMNCLIEGDLLGTQLINEAGILGTYRIGTFTNPIITPLECARVVRFSGNFAYTGVPRTTIVRLL